MKKTKMLFAVLFLAVLSTIIAGCGSDSNTSGALTVTTASLPGVTVNTAYSQTLAASGGTAPYTWSISVGALPAGLSLNAATGAITGTPTTVATTSFTVKVTDSATPVSGTATMALSIAVTAPGAALAVTTASLPGVTVNTAYSQTLAASGGTAPYTWSISVGTLPAGLSLNAATGAITGTPTTVATTSFTVKVTDSATPVSGTATMALSITVNAAGAALSITTTSPLVAATYGTTYSQTLAAAGGTTPFTWALTAGALPAGLTLSATGVITGTPTAPAVPNATPSNFTVGVTDAVLGTATMPLAITASLSASALSGKTTYDANCAGCHSLGIYDATGSPNLGGLGAATLTTALNARFAGGISHNGRTLTATLITDMLNFLSLY